MVAKVIVQIKSAKVPKEQSVAFLGSTEKSEKNCVDNWDCAVRKNIFSEFALSQNSLSKFFGLHKEPYKYVR